MSIHQPNPSLLRLLQIISPSLPVGSYSYSQGLEWAVQAGWVSNADECSQWLIEQLGGTLASQDLPLLQRLYRSLIDNNVSEFARWDAISLAMRETSELRRDEEQRGQALVSLLRSLDISMSAAPDSYAGAFALFCVGENISVHDTLAGYAYSWLDSQVTAAIKLVPLGQAEGQGLLYRLSSDIPAVIQEAMSVEDEDVGYTSPALAMASSLHETQYSRLFRS